MNLTSHKLYILPICRALFIMVEGIVRISFSAVQELKAAKYRPDIFWTDAILNIVTETSNEQTAHYTLQKKYLAPGSSTNKIEYKMIICLEMMK